MARDILAAVDPFTAPREPVDEPVLAPERDWPVVYARRAAFGVYAIAFIAGLSYGISPTSAVRLFTGLAGAWAIAYYCALDARAHGVVFPHSFWLFTSLSWPVAPLFHFVRVRGGRGALAYLLHAVGVAICWVGSNAFAKQLFHG